LKNETGIFVRNKMPLASSLAIRMAAHQMRTSKGDLVPTFIQAQVGNALGLASDLRQHGFYTL
jgi:hypothetical protein